MSPQQSKYPDQLLADIWRRAIDPSNVGLAEGIADDLASFTGESVETVLARMSTGMEDFKQLWQNTDVNPSDPGSVAEFYRDQFVEAYELAQWHCGRTTGQLPLNYARATAFATEIGATRILDFGSGIGSGSIALAGTGAEVHSADVAQRLLKLVGHRLKRHGYQPTLIDLASGDKPRTAYYDLITCFDVLEHVPDQLATVRELQGYLRRGGRLIANFVEDSTHEDRPMHVSSAGNWVRMIRKTSLCPDWKAFARVEIPIVTRRPFARIRNIAATALHGE